MFEKIFGGNKVPKEEKNLLIDAIKNELGGEEISQTEEEEKEEEKRVKFVEKTNEYLKAWDKKKE